MNSSSAKNNSSRGNIYKKITFEQKLSQIENQKFQKAMTDTIYMDNVEFIRDQIDIKTSSSEPYYATVAHAKGVITDYDEFPYRRHYRGYYASANPIVDQRAAGFRPRIDSCYKPEMYKQDTFCKPDLCWQSGSTVTYPCRSNFLKKYADIDEIRQLLDYGCITQYR